MRGRFAPSPTGQLHLGNAYTALLSWLHVRAAGGQFLLRIEDLDAARCRPEYLDSLLRDLEYLGLPWDEEPLFQSRRMDAYRQALIEFQQRGLTYPCFCSRAEISRAASAPHGEADDGPRYPGTCAALGADQVRERASKRKPAIRFRADPAPVNFTDDLQGLYAEDVRSRVGDFVICRNDGVASYQLAVVIDDAQSGISHVLRGADLLSSTARQLQLYRALQLPAPRFAHVPLLVDSEGARLAKREGTFSVSQLRALGVEAARVVGLLAQWAGLHDGTPALAVDLISSFSLERLPRAPVRVREEQVREWLRLEQM
jgi:glutamyl-tRNA synthetase